MTALVIYQKFQTGKLWAVAVLIVFFGASGVAAGAGSNDAVSPSFYVVVVVAVTTLVAMVLTFNRLMVVVTSAAVTVAFGWGWPRKTIQRSDIVSHHVTRNSPILGWGIRWFRGGTMWNVWGLDAVELQLDSGRKFRIGTNDPAGLDAALSR